MAFSRGRGAFPKDVLEAIRLLLQVRAARCNELWREYGIEIDRREVEPRRLTGFNEIRVREPGAYREMVEIGEGDQSAAKCRSLPLRGK